MPIYEYRCDACGHCLDALQKIADDPLRDCPACEASALRRLVSAPNFRLKGKGWYETDFKSDKETRRNLFDHPDEPSAAKDKGESRKDKGESRNDDGESRKGEGSSKAEGSSTKKAADKSGADAGAKSPSRPGSRSDSAAA